MLMIVLMTSIMMTLHCNSLYKMWYLPLIHSLNQFWCPIHAWDSKALQHITSSPQRQGFGIGHSLIWPSGFSHIAADTWQPQSAGSPPLLAHQEAQFGSRAPQMRGTWDERYLRWEALEMSGTWDERYLRWEVPELRGTSDERYPASQVYLYVWIFYLNSSVPRLELRNGYTTRSTVWILCGRLKILSSWVLAWFACFQIFGHSNKWTKAGIKYCKYCECCEILPPIGDNFLSTSFHLYCAEGGGSWNPSALSEWEFEELWEARPLA